MSTDRPRGVGGSGSLPNNVGARTDGALSWERFVFLGVARRAAGTIRGR